MTDSTLDHTEPRREGCRCQDAPLPLTMCPECYARFEKSWAEIELLGWVGKLRPRLRLVVGEKR